MHKDQVLTPDADEVTLFVLEPLSIMVIDE